MEDDFKTSRIVIDASVVLAWILPLETLQENANALLKHYDEQRADVRCPPLFAYEVLNGLRSAVLAGRIKGNQLNESYTRFHAIGIPLDDSFVPDDETLQIAMHYDLSLYDASYIHFAAQQKRALYTADRKFVNKLKATKMPIVYLGDFR